MTGRLLRLLADRQLRADNDELRSKLREEESRTKLLGVQQEILLDVIERDRLRVQAEAGAYAAQIAEPKQPHGSQ